MVEWLVSSLDVPGCDLNLLAHRLSLLRGPGCHRVDCSTVWTFRITDLL